MKAAEEVTALNALSAQLQKANTEIQGKIKDLTDAINNADVPAEVTTALAGVTTAAQTLDDIVPDASPLQVPPGAGSQVPPMSSTTTKP